MKNPIGGFIMCMSHILHTFVHYMTLKFALFCSVLSCLFINTGLGKPKIVCSPLYVGVKKRVCGLKGISSCILKVYPDLSSISLSYSSMNKQILH